MAPFVAERPQGVLEEAVGNRVASQGQVARQAAVLHAVSQPAPLLGRTPELRTLLEIASRVVSTERAQVVTLTGSAGVGKSRLVEQLGRDLTASQPCMRICRGWVQQDETGFVMTQRLLRARFAIPQALAPQDAQEVLRQAVTETTGDRRAAETLHFLGAFLKLRFPESPFLRAVEDEPVQHDQLRRVVLRSFLELDAKRRPLLLVFEDLHWASSEELQLIQYLLSSLRQASIMMLCVTRAEGLAHRHDWFEAGEEHTKVELSPLDEEASMEVVAELTRSVGGTSEALAATLANVAAGNPYLIEQTVRDAFAKGSVTRGRQGAWELSTHPQKDSPMPCTMEAAVGTRVASLSPAERELLEMAASMGYVFWLGALVSLHRAGRPAPELWAGGEDTISHYRTILTELVRRDYVMCLPDASIPGESEFAFKHNLEREALQTIVAPAKMREYRLAVAEWLEFRLPEKTEEQCAMLASFFRQGGDSRKAAEYYVRAGKMARERYANYQAAEYYNRAVELLGARDPVRRVEIYHELGDVLALGGRLDDALTAFREMQQLSYRFDLRAKAGAAHNRMGRVHRDRNNLDSALEHLEAGFNLFCEESDARGIASSHDDIGKVFWLRGEYSKAEHHMLKGLQLRQSLGHRRSIALSHNNLGLVYQDLGRGHEALEAFSSSLKIRRSIDDLPGLAQSLNNLAFLQKERGQTAEAIEHWKEALGFAKHVGDRSRQALICTNLGASCSKVGDVRGAAEALATAAELAASINDDLLEADALRRLAQVLVRRGDGLSARNAAERAVTLARRLDKPAYLAQALQAAGEVSARAEPPVQDVSLARRHFEEALDLYRKLGDVKSLESTANVYSTFIEEVVGSRQAGEDPAPPRASSTPNSSARVS